MPLFHFQVILSKENILLVRANGFQYYWLTQQTPSLILIKLKKVILFGIDAIIVRTIVQIIMMSYF